MPPDKMNEKNFIKLLEYAAKHTWNFQKIEPEFLANNPKTVKTFRMLYGKGLIEFAKLLKKNFNTISQYELGGIRRIRLAEAKRMSDILAEKMPVNPSKEQAIENFRKFKELSTGGAVQGFMRAEKAVLTADEKMIRNLLQEYGIRFEVHKTLDTNIGQLNFDFLIEDKALIECTDSKSKQKAESLGFRALKIKQKYPHLKTIVVIPHNVTNGIKRRLADFDYVIFSNKLNELEVILK